jgi:hypothetical protein
MLAGRLAAWEHSDHSAGGFDVLAIYVRCFFRREAIVELVAVLIAFVTLVVAIPPAITAMRDLGWIGAGTPVPPTVPVEATRSDTEAPAPDHGERVLLTLKPDRAAIPGTLEHDLVDFEVNLPQRYRSNDPLRELNGLIRNPGMIRWSAGSTARMSKVFIAIFSFMGLAMSVTTSATPSYRTTEGIFFLTGFIFVLVVIVVPLYITGRNGAKAVHVVEEYLKYLRANQIEIGTELTQSRVMSEKQSPASVGA